MSYPTKTIPTLKVAQIAVVMVQNTWYTVCDLKGGVIFHQLDYVINAAIGAEDIEVRVTADTNQDTFQDPALAVHTHKGMYYFLQPAALPYINWTPYVAGTYAPADTMFFCRNLKIEIRKTSATGAQEIDACVMYAQY